MLTFQRYKARKAAALAEQGRTGAAGVFKAAYLADPGELLPEGFINAKVYELLTTAQPVPYLSWESLRGATLEELVKIKGIARKTAEKILAAVAERFGD